VTAVLMSVLPLVVVLVFAVALGVVAYKVERKWSSRWLWVVWLAPPVLFTVFLLSLVDYTVHTLISRPVLWFALVNFGLMGFSPAW
jgi:hypothetical protein